MSALRHALRELPETVFADFLESDDEYLVVVDVPGVTAETVDIHLEGDTLRIDGRRDIEPPSSFEYTDEERDHDVDLELPVPPDATDRGATAAIERGVLEVRLSKRTESSETTIPVERG